MEIPTIFNKYKHQRNTVNDVKCFLSTLSVQNSNKSKTVKPLINGIVSFSPILHLS